MYIVEIDGYKFNINREFNEDGPSVLSQIINYLIDLEKLPPFDEFIKKGN